MSVQTMEEANNNLGSMEQESEISLFDILLFFLKYKFFVFGVPFVVALLVAAGSLLIPNTYTSKGQIILPQPQSGASAILGQLGGLSSAVGGALGGKNPADVYIAMLKSRTMAELMIARFKLHNVYQEHSRENVIKILAAQSEFAVNKDGTIKIAVSGKNPKFATVLANAYIEELQKMTLTFALTEASQRRVLFEQQIQKVRKDLGDAEDALKHLQEKTGLIQLNSQAEVLIKAMVELKTQISSKEVALESMSTFATSNHPDYVRYKTELAALRTQLQKAENGVSSGAGSISVATGKVPEFGLEYVRKLRDVKYYEVVLELLAKQFEIAKIDEAKQSTLIQVLDKAEVPEYKSGPKRSVMVLLSGLMTMFLMIIVVFAKEMWERSKKHPDFQEKITLLKRYSGINDKKSHV